MGHLSLPITATGMSGPHPISNSGARFQPQSRSSSTSHCFSARYSVIIHPSTPSTLFRTNTRYMYLPTSSIIVIALLEYIPNIVPSAKSLQFEIPTGSHFLSTWNSRLTPFGLAVYVPVADELAIFPLSVKIKVLVGSRVLFNPPGRAHVMYEPKADTSLLCFMNWCDHHHIGQSLVLSYISVTAVRFMSRSHKRTTPLFFGNGWHSLNTGGKNSLMLIVTCLKWWREGLESLSEVEKRELETDRYLAVEDISRMLEGLIVYLTK
ncbi:hypothetical protein EV359DRAFT_64153 [Lentinula novae-zelandiae]|nr:hypothetical protein EV359DRAFT_64153 [Lentinula novae-zelandiae]